MGSYYYLASQLPYLIYGQTPPMSSEAFKYLAKPLLGKADANLLELVSPDPFPAETSRESPNYEVQAPPSGSSFIDNWREWERTLRLNLAKFRAAKLKRDNVISAEPPSAPSDAVIAASRIFASAESPLEGEIQLDKARWSAIDEMQGADIFSNSSIFAYLLKLMLLERHSSFQADAGFIEYKSLYASIVGGVENNGDIK